MHSSAYYSYIMRLIKLAEYHDEFDSNNIWRMMTHESIKNLDWTFFRENGDDVEDMSNIDSSRIEAILQLYGRQYDGLKRYIDNIKHTNKVTYDQKNNIPDYLLTDTVENSGFEAILPIPTAKTSVETETLYSGLSKGFNEVDLNTYFMRNLKLNAPYLNSVKGTREGIEAMLGLLGFSGSEYTINEYITVAKGSKPYCEMDSNAIFGVPSGEAQRNNNCAYPAAIDIEMVNVNKDSFPINELADDYYGIACKPVIVYKQNGTIDYRYVVPWFENGKYYDGNWYFQCNGGWGKQDSINVSGMTILDNPIGISELSGDFIYEETENRMRYAQNIDEMLSIFPSELEDNDICYVTDVSNLLTAYGGVYSANTTVINEFNNNNPSHYFVIKNKTEYCVLGNNGWNYIPLSDITGATSDDAKKVIYLETIKDNTTGNNPHVAKKQYDNGEEYVERLDYIFKEGVETNDFTYFSDQDINEAIKKYKFNILSAYTVDNRKSDYFFPKELSNLTISGNSRALTGITEFTNEQKIINPEGGTTCKEPAANSLINLKNIEITFIPPTKNEDALKIWKYYLKTVVFKYIEQILPSTCILSWKIEGEQPTPPEPDPTLTVTKTEFTFESGSSRSSFTVNAGYQGWSISNNCGWVSTSPNSKTQSGRTSVSVSVTENTSAEERNCSFCVNGSRTGSYTINVSQKAKYIPPVVTVTRIDVNIINVPVIPASGGSVNKDTSGVIYTVVVNYSDGNSGTTSNVSSNTVSAVSKGTTASTQTDVDTLIITAIEGGVTGSSGMTVYQEANVVISNGSISGKTNENVSGWTVNGTTYYDISVNPVLIHALPDSGSKDMTISSSAITSVSGFTASTWDVTETPWSAYTSNASGYGETIITGSDSSEPTYTGGTLNTLPTGSTTLSTHASWVTANTSTIQYAENTSTQSRNTTVTYGVQGHTNITGTCRVEQEGKTTRTITIQPSGGRTNWNIEMTRGAIPGGYGDFYIQLVDTTSGTGAIHGYGEYTHGNSISWLVTGGIQYTTDNMTQHDIILKFIGDSNISYGVEGTHELNQLNGNAASGNEIDFNFIIPADGNISNNTISIDTHNPNLIFNFD